MSFIFAYRTAQKLLRLRLSHCVTAAFAVGAALVLRLMLSEFFGSDLPYITFYPAIMVTAILGGSGPGLLATGLAALCARAWILPANGHFGPISTSGSVGLAVFVSMGALISIVAGLYRMVQENAAYLRELALEEGEERFHTMINSERKQVEALRAANAQLADTNRRKDEFLAMLAHELRNPLAPIRFALQILNASCGRTGCGTLEHTVRQRQIIDRQVTHMARLLEDLLDVSRVTRGTIVLVRQHLLLADVLAQAVETATPLLEARRHTLHVASPPAGLRVEGDIDRLAQVFGNLLANSAKYTDEGGHVWLQSWCEGDQVVISVRDSGVGIAPEMLSRVFELFAQADQSLGRSRGGLGIGLTMVQKLVELHGGRVEAHSEGLGKGSEFIVRLPVLTALSEFRSEREQKPADDQHGFRRSGPRRVMVVDDVPDVAESVAVLLQMWGFEVKTANSGPSALGVADDFRPEIALLDVGMPGMDGFEVARRLRARYGSGILLVAMTGYGQNEDRREAEQAGFDRLLVKPVEPVVLRELLAASDPTQVSARSAAKLTPVQ